MRPRTKAIQLLHIILFLVISMLCLSSCKQRNGVLEEANVLLSADPEMSGVFSTINVEVSDGDKFNAMLVFEEISNEMIRKISPEEGCAIAEIVHHKIKETIITMGYSDIVWIEAMIYPSDWKEVKDDYILSFGVAAKNKTRVKLWCDPHNPLWAEPVAWGGFAETGGYE